MPSDPIIIEEPWLEITTRTGLKIECPAPKEWPEQLSGDSPLPWKALSTRGTFIAQSRIDGATYVVSLEDVVSFKMTTRRHDPERHQRSLLRATKNSSPTSSGSSQAAASTSAFQASPSSGSPGVASLRTIH